MSRGKIYVIAAPSGAGKSTLINALRQHHPQLQLSISHTTRQKRHSEEDGVNYYFIPVEEFKAMIARQEFLEYAQVYDNYYGTSLKTIAEFLAHGQDIILEIDWQGARQIRQLYPDAVSIFIAPPSLTTLAERLTARNSDSPEVISKRLSLARSDMTHAEEFDYIVINNNFTAAVQDLCSIIRADQLTATNMLQLVRQQCSL